MNNKVEFKIPIDKKEYNYIGFDIGNNNQFVFPPKYFGDNKPEEKEYKKEAKKIITLLKKFRQEYFINGNQNELFQFYSMIWLIKDFLEHGYYVEMEHTSKISENGKINWKKTIKHNSILFDKGNIIYKKFVRDKVISNDSQILIQIYKACLKFSIDKLGFIFDIHQTENSIYNIEKEKEFLIYYLNTELNNTFKDYKKLVLQHLISIIANQNSKQKNDGFSIYDAEFEYVFEFLINKMFGTENVKDFYNTYSYYIPSRFLASPLRPDTIMKDSKQKVYYILDAKYYNFGYSQKTQDLPQASSISKQISYNHYLRDNLKEQESYKVKSVFVLPFSKSEDDDYIKYIGYAVRDDNSNNDDKVMIVLIDLKTLIDRYLTNDTNVLKQRFLELLNKQNF